MHTNGYEGWELGRSGDVEGNMWESGKGVWGLDLDRSGDEYENMWKSGKGNCKEKGSTRLREWGMSCDKKVWAQRDRVDIVINLEINEMGMDA